jgi:hypothetical protein
MAVSQGQAAENAALDVLSAPFVLNGMRVDPAGLAIDRDGEKLRIDAKVMEGLLTLVHLGNEVVSLPDIAERERSLVKIALEAQRASAISCFLLTSLHLRTSPPQAGPGIADSEL